MGLSSFLKENVVKTENTKAVISKRMINEETGEPELWELKALDTAEAEEIRSSCMRRVPVPGKKNQYTTELDDEKYTGKLCAACVVYPPLLNAELQDSYGVKTPDALVKKMLEYGEYMELNRIVIDLNGLSANFDELVEEAKN